MSEEFGNTLMTEGLAEGGAPGAERLGTGQPGTEQPGASAAGQEQGPDGKTLLSGLGKGEGEDSAAQQKEPEDPAAQVPESPEGYAIQFAEGLALDGELLGAFQKTAHELGINQGQAQKLADMYAEHAALAEQAQVKALLEARRLWEGEIKQSPTFEVDKARIQAVFRRFGTPQLYDLLDQTNLGSHPDFFRFLANVGRALGEPEFRGGAGGGELSAARIMYPDMN